MRAASAFPLSRRAMIAGTGAAILMPGALAARKPLTLARLIARHTRARGGAAALDRVHACLIEIDMVERGQTLHGRYAASAGAEGTLVRIDVYADGKRVFSEGVDRRGVWNRGAGDAAPEPSVATGAANALLHGAENHLFGLHRFPARGHKLRMMPAERIGGVDYPVVEVVYTTGHTSYFYFDPSRWMIVRRRDERAYHPDVDPTRQRVETLYSDFQAVDGVVAAHRNVDVDLATGAELSRVQVASRILNPALPEGLFERGYKPADSL
jgi:hypothetical protein